MIAMKDVSNMTFIVHVFSKTMIDTKFIKILRRLICKIRILFFLNSSDFTLFIPNDFIIKFCCSLVDGNRKPENRFESYEDLLQKKRAQERRYRLLCHHFCQEGRLMQLSVFIVNLHFYCSSF